jgi:hypothetical protein
MQIRHDKNKPKPSTHQFAAVEGHRSIIDVDGIKKGNEDRKRERVLKAAADAVNVIAETVRNHKAKQKAAQILSEEN